MKFIVFEGIDGSGLSTQSYLLKEYLLTNNKKVLLTKEPTDGLIGMLIRNTLKKRIKFDEITLSLLFAADRMDHLSSLNFDNYDYVISDRYYISNFAYQSQKVDLNFLIEINRYARTPDLVIFLDVKPEICIERIKHNRDHIEIYENIKQLKIVKENYLKILEYLKKKGQNIVIIDGNKSIEEVHKEVIKWIKF